MAKTCRVPPQQVPKAPRARFGMLTTIKEPYNLHSDTVPEDESPNMRLGMLTTARQPSASLAVIIQYDKNSSIHLNIPTHHSPRTPLSPSHAPEMFTDRPHGLDDSPGPRCALFPRAMTASASDAQAETDAPDSPTPPKSQCSTAVNEIAKKPVVMPEPLAADLSAGEWTSADLPKAPAVTFTRRLSEPEMESKWRPIVEKRRLSDADFITAGVAQITALHLRPIPAPAPRNWERRLEISDVMPEKIQLIKCQTRREIACSEDVY